MNEKACANGCIGVIIGPSDEYCYKCGAELVARPKCECGRAYLAGVERFCPKCGKPVGGDPLLAGARNAAMPQGQAQKKVEGAA